MQQLRDEPSARRNQAECAPLGVGAAQKVRGHKLLPAGMRPVQLCQQGPEHSPARVWRGATAARPAGRACAAGRHTPARGRRPERARPQTCSGAHAACAAVSARPRTVTCPSLKRRGSRTAGRARLCRLAPARPERGRRPERARPQTRSGWHAARAAVSTRPRTVTCLSLERRGSRTAGRERLCRWAPHTNALARQRSGWHAGRAAVLTRPRTATCPSLARRNSCTAGRARLHRQAPARQGGRGSSARRRASAPADIRAAQLCQQGPEHSPARA